MGQFDDETAVRRGRAWSRHPAVVGVEHRRQPERRVRRPAGAAGARATSPTGPIRRRSRCTTCARRSATPTARSPRTSCGPAGGRPTRPATLTQDGAARLDVAAVLTDLAVPASDVADPGVTLPRARHPAAGALRRPGRARPGHRAAAAVAGRGAGSAGTRQPPGAVVEGWIRFRDGTAPTTSALVLFADAFPPAVHAVVARVGWVPTLELTVHVRRRPAAGWVQARLECDDVAGGWMVESGTLWDETGAVVAPVAASSGMILDRA